MIAIAILMDVSGSMAQPPANESSGQPKITTARQSLQRVIAKTAEFAEKHPDKNVLLGIYEFSALGRGDNADLRKVIPLAPPNVQTANAALARMKPVGGTPIGDAILGSKKELDRSGYTHQHILVVTDGENNHGYSPSDVVNAINRLDEQRRATVYFIAFDVAAEKFNRVRDSGALVLSASNASELDQTLDYILTGKILVEQPGG